MKSSGSSGARRQQEKGPFLALAVGLFCAPAVLAGAVRCCACLLKPFRNGVGWAWLGSLVLLLVLLLLLSLGGVWLILPPRLLLVCQHCCFSC